MNLLIVYTHPNHESLNAGFLKSVIDGIDKNPTDISVQTLDLYQEGFNPLLVFNSEKKRRFLNTDPELESHRAQILWANHIVFIYPIWWGRPPAMLFGYFDRLFTSGFAYEYTKKGPYPKGLFKGKKVTCISTMKGPTHYPFLFLNNAHKVLMRKALFNFVGIKKVKFFEFGSVEKKEGKQKKYLKRVETYFQGI